MLYGTPREEWPQGLVRQHQIAFEHVLQRVAIIARLPRERNYTTNRKQYDLAFAAAGVLEA